MAGTRTVHRGSRGRFAGASGGKAERVRVGTRLSSGTTARSPKVTQKRRGNTKQFNQFLDSRGKTNSSGGVANRARFVAHNSGLSGKAVAKGIGKAAKSPLGSYLILSAAGAGVAAVAGSRRTPATKNGLSLVAKNASLYRANRNVRKPHYGITWTSKTSPTWK